MSSCNHSMRQQCVFCFFFFSSRRRHTRLQGDWSSDVCSSDLLVALVRQNGGAGNGCHGGTGDPCSRVVAPAFLALRALGQAGQDAETPAAAALDPHLPAAQVIAPVLVVAAVASQGLDQLYLLDRKSTRPNSS